MPPRRAATRRSRPALLVAALAVAAGSAAAGIARAGDGPALEPALRRPVALVLEGERRLWVANGRSGSLSLVDTDRLEVVAEFEVAGSLTDLLGAPGGRLLALDGREHRLLVLASGADAPRPEILSVTPVAPYPARLALSGDGRRCFVTSTWSRRLDVLELSEHAPPRRLHSVELPFAPRESLLLDEERLLVADAFGGGLAVVDARRGELERRHELPVHNIGGLALTSGGEQLVIAHQSLNPYATTSREDVFWGGLVSNRLLLADPASVTRAEGEVLRHSRSLDLGDLTSPAGDPGRIAVTPRGELVVSLAGTGRVALGRAEWPRLDHVRTGRRPTALAAGRDGRVWVANTLSDTISVVDVATRRRTGEVALGPPVELALVDRGEALFYDAELSLRGWMSCHSCHTDGHANGGLADTRGDGGFGAPKRIPSLLGVAETGPWAWNGSMDTLEAQVRKSVHSTLNNREADPGAIRALAAFLGTLRPPALPADADPEAAGRGRRLFASSGCDGCHTPPTYTSARARDVGLVDEAGNRRFNAPSLRGVRHRSSFLHDGRARRLEEVFSAHGHPGTALSAGEIRDLVAFLTTL